MFTGSIDEKVYTDCMEALKKALEMYHDNQYSGTFLAGKKQEKLKALFHSGFVGFFRDGYGYIRNKFQMIKLNSIVKPLNRKINELPVANYFSDEKIAVYTCVFGKYDTLSEPFSHPNNIDYYIITDQVVPASSTWKQVDLAPYSGILEGKTNVEKNRWFKMHPHEVFKNYRYSVYVDGNVVPVSDFTELVNRIGDAGIAMFWHSYNNCVYQEAYYNRYSVKKIKKEELESHISFLRRQGMPEDFGMTTCNVIARDHQNSICKQLMEDWWQEFMTHCRRDQISFPYVVWKNGIQMNSIARLGYDVWRANSLIVKMHE